MKRETCCAKSSRREREGERERDRGAEVGRKREIDSQSSVQYVNITSGTSTCVFLLFIYSSLLAQTKQ